MREIQVRKAYPKEEDKTPVFEYRRDWPYISIGFGNERDYFIENLSLLISSGMGISAALNSISSSVKTWKMKRITAYIEESVNAGLPLWQAFRETKFFPDRVISLIRSGEEAGRLPEHLNLVTLQQHKEKVFQSRLRSALLYPGIVIVLAFCVALGGSWFVLPNFVSFFDSTTGPLPLTTRMLIWFAAVLKAYGFIVVPAIFVLVFLAAYLLFINKKTKFVGDWALLHTPGIQNLVQSIELGRFGYTFGALLQAGFHMSEALESVKEGTNYAAYRAFYQYMQESIVRGESFRTTLTSYPHADRFIPIPIQQLISAAEQSGKLSETLMKIGVIFEEKTDAMSQDLSTVLEPIVLIVVGLIVGFVVTAVLGPIYGLSNQI